MSLTSKYGRNPSTDRLERVRKAIHACRRQVAGLEDDAVWRDWLSRVPGANGLRSLRAMSGPQLGAVLDALHAAGAPRRAGGPSRYADNPQLSKIRALWLALHRGGQVRDPSEQALGSFIRAATKQDMGRLPTAAANTVIERLKKWCARTGVPLETPP